MTWTPIWALPNIALDEPVESTFFALAPSDDERVRSLLRDHHEFRKLMRQFRDIHGRRIQPALILRRANAPKRLMISDAVVSFRDILVISSVPYARSKNLIYNNHRNQPALSNYFWVFPWMMDRHFKHVISVTPITHSLHEASAVHGQSSPELIPIQIRRRDFDEPLMNALLDRWTSRYVAATPTWQNIALFRSLNIANQACQIPSGPDATIFDFGRIISLWASAFETLVHPGANGNVTQKEVYELFERVPWLDTRCNHRLYKTRFANKYAKRNIACWIYGQIYNCRNRFLHGNPVTFSTLKIQRSSRPIVNFAPPLYRLGLTSFLDLSLNEAPPAAADAELFAAFIARSMEFEGPQKDAESAIRRALITVREQERLHEARVENARNRSRQIQARLNSAS